MTARQFTVTLPRGTAKALKFSRGATPVAGATEIPGLAQHADKVRREDRTLLRVEESLHIWASNLLHDEAQKLHFATPSRGYKECAKEAMRRFPDLSTLATAEIVDDSSAAADIVMGEE